MSELLQVAEETIANDEVVVIKGGQSGRAVSVLLRGANDYMLDEMDRSLHDSFCVVKRVLESGAVVPGVDHSASFCLLNLCFTLLDKFHVDHSFIHFPGALFFLAKIKSQVYMSLMSVLWV